MSSIDWAVAQALGGQQIDGELYRLRAEHEARLRSTQAELEAQCANTEALRTECGENLEIPNDPVQEAAGILAKAQTALADKKEDLQRARQTREAYRLRHGLTRMPVDPSTVQNLLFLAIVIFVEAGINASFFQNAYMVASPFAALLLSVLISITNVSVSTCAGYFIGRWLSYGRDAADANAPEFIAIRRRAMVLFCGFLAVIAVFHITVGLVRATETLDHIRHNLANYQAVLTTPEALFLILTGACLSALAYHKGQHAFADPYPGYGQRQRAVQAVQDEIFDLYDESAQEIEDCFADAHDAIKKHARKQQRACQQYNKAVRHCVTARRNLERGIGRAESELRMQVAQLATAHLSSRGRKSVIIEQALDHLVQFNGFLDAELPPYVQARPDPALQTEFAQAKSEALARLSALFQDIVDPHSGEPS